jgi:hypothetical protein
MRPKRWRRDRTREPVHVTHFEETIFDEWLLEDGYTMRVSAIYFARRDRVHIRRWRRGANGATKEGATITIDQLPRLLRALKSVRAHARQIGLLPPPSRSR